MEETVTLRLTPDEALVLFDFLQRFDATDTLSIDDPAEQRALWNLSCLLERELTEPFLPDYAEHLAAARDRLREFIF
jgi:hypothetical protein